MRPMGCGHLLNSAFSGMSFSGMSFIGSSVVVAGLIVTVVWLFSLVVVVIGLPFSCVVAVSGIVP